MVSSDIAEKIYCAKRDAAQKALGYVDNNMRVGLGTGSTVNIFIDLLSHKVKSENLNIHCVATSEVTFKRASQQGLSFLPNNICDYLDITIDGADEFDSQFRLIKGGGGALLREKIIAQASNHFIIIADDTKYVDCLGNFPLPVECVNYESAMIFKQLEKIFNRYAHSSSDDFIPIFRKNNHNSSVFLTDLGHNIIDINFKKIIDPESLAYDLHNISGVVDHGLFLKEAHTILTNSHMLNKKG